MNNSEMLPYVHHDVDLSNIAAMDHLRAHHGGHSVFNSSGGSEKSKARRNTWNEKKNAILVETVKNSKYPTPWRPKHGTNKEIWSDIANQMMQRTDVFDTPIHWESAKDQLLKIIDRQRLRRSLGDYSIKSETELYVDEMIKHVTADDEEKLSAMKKQKDRASKRQFRRSTGDMGDGEGDYDDSDDEMDREKRLKIGEAVGDVLSHRLIAELQNCKQMTKTGNDLLSQPHLDNSDALLLVQQQLTSCQAVLGTAQALLLRIVGAADSNQPAAVSTPSLAIPK